MTDHNIGMKRIRSVLLVLKVSFTIISCTLVYVLKEAT